MDQSALERLLGSRDKTQREKLAVLADAWGSVFARMSDDELLICLRLIHKAINSKKLRTRRDALIAALRRDGAGPGAPLPKPRPEQAPPAASPANATADTSGAGAGPFNPALEAEIAADPGARAPYLVYRDWLEERGLVIDGRVTLGPLADADDMLGELDWQLGFIRACRLSYSSARFNDERPELSIEDALAYLLDVPGPGRFVQRLTIGLARHDDNDYGGVCKVIGARPRPALRELFLGDFGYEECELNWSTIGDAAPLWPALPRLRKLTLRAGAMTLDAIDLPELRELSTVTGGMPATALAAIASARWPKLERLDLQVGVSHQGAATEVSLVDPLLAGAECPELRELGLTNCEFTDELCARLPSAAILPQLRTIDLSMGTMTMVGARALARHPQAFAHLSGLVVVDNYLPDEALPLLEQLGVPIVFGEQRRERDGRRYASAYE